jgi:hypothetical protein
MNKGTFIYLRTGRFVVFALLSGVPLDDHGRTARRQRRTGDAPCPFRPLLWPHGSTRALPGVPARLAGAAAPQECRTHGPGRSRRPRHGERPRRAAAALSDPRALAGQRRATADPGCLRRAVGSLGRHLDPGDRGRPGRLGLRQAGPAQRRRRPAAQRPPRQGGQLSGGRVPGRRHPGRLCSAGSPLVPAQELVARPPPAASDPGAGGHTLP